MKMKKIMLILFVATMMGCEKQLDEDELSSKREANADCIEKPVANVVCITLYDPVCGCNNKTYGNYCVAESMGIKNYTKGECKK